MNRRLSLPFDQWPAADRALWQSAIADGDILDGAGPCSDWAPATRKNCRKAYGYWLQWLSDHDGIDAEIAPLDRLTPERIASYIRALESGVAPTTVFAYVLKLQAYVKRLAPARDWSWLIAIKNRLGARAHPARDKTARIRPAEELFSLGLALMETAPGYTSRYNKRADAIRFRNGLIVALLAARPIRLKNLAAIETGNHLVRVDGTYWLRLEADEVKNRKHIEVTLPDTLTPYIDRYLVRPWSAPDFLI